MQCEQNMTYTFEQALVRLDRGQFEGLESLLQRVAAGYRLTRDEVWAVASDLWRFVERAERRTLSAWEGSVARFLKHPAGRASLLKARGLRPADVRDATASGTTADRARLQRLEAARVMLEAVRTPDAPLHDRTHGCHRDAIRHLSRLLGLAGVEVGDFIAILSQVEVDPLALAAMTDLKRGVGVWLLVESGYSYAELSLLTGKSEAALRMAKSRGQRRLTKLCLDVAADDENQDDDA
jgi:hypothetical protein